jgi:hypothetical protein
MTMAALPDNSSCPDEYFVVQLPRSLVERFEAISKQALADNVTDARLASVTIDVHGAMCVACDDGITFNARVVKQPAQQTLVFVTPRTGPKRDKARLLAVGPTLLAATPAQSDAYTASVAARRLRTAMERPSLERVADGPSASRPVQRAKRSQAEMDNRCDSPRVKRNCTEDLREAFATSSHLPMRDLVRLTSRTKEQLLPDLDRMCTQLTHGEFRYQYVLKPQESAGNILQ